jgi:hypothetical protein
MGGASSPVLLIETPYEGLWPKMAGRDPNNPHGSDRI